MPAAPSRLQLRAGSIKRVKLTDFMCHSELVVDFKTQVSFVTGHNGSKWCLVQNFLELILYCTFYLTLSIRFCSRTFEYCQKNSDSYLSSQVGRVPSLQLLLLDWELEQTWQVEEPNSVTWSNMAKSNVHLNQRNEILGWIWACRYFLHVLTCRSEQWMNDIFALF